MTISEARPGNHNLRSFLTPTVQYITTDVAPNHLSISCYIYPSQVNDALKMGHFNSRSPESPRMHKKLFPRGWLNTWQPGFLHQTFLIYPHLFGNFECVSHTFHIQGNIGTNLCMQECAKVLQISSEQPEIILNCVFKIWIMNHMLSLSFYP